MYLIYSLEIDINVYMQAFLSQHGLTSNGLSIHFLKYGRILIRT